VKAPNQIQRSLSGAGSVHIEIVFCSTRFRLAVGVLEVVNVHLVPAMIPGAAQILLPIAAAAFGMTAFGIGFPYRRERFRITSISG
jgi:hypothetical protein